MKKNVSGRMSYKEVLVGKQNPVFSCSREIVDDVDKKTEAAFKSKADPIDKGVQTGDSDVDSVDISDRTTMADAAVDATDTSDIKTKHSAASVAKNSETPENCHKNRDLDGAMGEHLTNGAPVNPNTNREAGYPSTTPQYQPRTYRGRGVGYKHHHPTTSYHTRSTFRPNIRPFHRPYNRPYCRPFYQQRFQYYPRKTRSSYHRPPHHSRPSAYQYWRTRSVWVQDKDARANNSQTLNKIFNPQKKEEKFLKEDKKLSKPAQLTSAYKKSFLEIIPEDRPSKVVTSEKGVRTTPIVSIKTTAQEDRLLPLALSSYTFDMVYYQDIPVLIRGE